MEFKGELVLVQKEDGSLQYRDDLSHMWCACGKGANNYFPENLDIYQFQCEKCAHGKREVIEGSYYEHYKGGMYQVVMIATAEWDSSDLVIYKDEQGKVWARDLKVFTGHKTLEDGECVKRFKRVIEN
ncbi:DUF1653 domain-containing protein [Bacillus manliponensis]|uniref:DUF1653 domain-containing protein n=1 Tax=Bacillus manliponensis TaxID=574376 RepID=UPI000557AEE3|nr:DUF1653 domain-containing protein [Bacillus manliponensis]